MHSHFHSKTGLSRGRFAQSHPSQKLTTKTSRDRNFQSPYKLYFMRRPERLCRPSHCIKGLLTPRVTPRRIKLIKAVWCDFLALLVWEKVAKGGHKGALLLTIYASSKRMHAFTGLCHTLPPAHPPQSTQMEVYNLRCNQLPQDLFGDKR